MSFIAAALLCATTAGAVDALIVSADADRMSHSNGGGAVAATWLRSREDRTVTAGASMLAQDNLRWAYATAGVTRRINPQTMASVEGNLGRGSDKEGAFAYVLLRAGATREVIPRRITVDVEWLQTDVARVRDGIAHAGVAWTPSQRLMFHPSVYRSVAGDAQTRLALLRADYDRGPMLIIAGVASGRAIPLLVNAPSGETSTAIRQWFGGVSVQAASRQWTVLLTVLSSGGARRERLSVACRIPLRRGPQ